MLSGRQVSCSCAKADPEIRRAARKKVPPEKRAEIARKALASRTSGRRPAFALTARQAAEILGVSVERIEALVRDDRLSYKWKDSRQGKKLYLSANEVAVMAAEQERQSRKCQHFD